LPASGSRQGYWREKIKLGVNMDMIKSYINSLKRDCKILKKELFRVWNKDNTEIYALMVLDKIIKIQDKLALYENKNLHGM